ncbi:NfeD family protein [Pelagicoccus sp. SDUM812002]|uniref:NfeD family protein n=1 Tax=Pelagicoccus sp. SDUM812002 TaxID=3041266 RepID=UPI0028105990|nr:NfeD family protein [Pelagicoccus sp. SDUM812002]MDQ8187313.1 NfeD family protein [Pelagicoccus sp. SDUM812002]
MSLIVGLIALGLGLIMLEIFIPGGIVGIFGGIAMLAAVVISFDQYGVEGAILTFVIGLVGLVACLWFEFKILPKTAAGKRLFLQDTIGGKSQPDVGDDSMIGRQVETATPLSPSGYIIVDGKKIEAVSRSGFLEKGESVKIDSFDQFRVTVSKL